MKSLILGILVLILLISAVRSEELADRHKVLCDIPEIKSLMAGPDSCQVLVTPVSENESKHICTGVSPAEANCEFDIVIKNQSANIKMKCMKTAEAPYEAEFKAEVIVYNVSVLITDANDQTYFINNPRTFKLFTNLTIDIDIIENIDGSTPLGAINFAGMNFEHVECH